MARVWIREIAGRFEARPLDAEGLTIGRLTIRRSDALARDTWVLIGSGRGVLVNGEPLEHGLRVLTHRDEIRAGDGTMLVFADDAPAARVTFEEGRGNVRCARCTGDVAVGEAVVRCPACRSWFHETADYPCWTSVPFCQVCGRRTDEDGDAVWRPEET